MQSKNEPWLTLQSLLQENENCELPLSSHFLLVTSHCWNFVNAYRPRQHQELHFRLIQQPPPPHWLEPGVAQWLWSFEISVKWNVFVLAVSLRRVLSQLIDSAKTRCDGRYLICLSQRKRPALVSIDISFRKTMGWSSDDSALTLYLNPSTIQLYQSF